MASYEETLVSISLDADSTLAVDTSPPYIGNTAPTGGSAAAGFQYRFVFISGDNTCGLFDGTNSGDVPVGVLQNKPQIEGMAATVAVAGVSLVEVGDDTITAGDALEVDDTGRVEGEDGGVVVGIALNGGEEGELIPVLLRLTGVAVPA